MADVIIVVKDGLVQEVYGNSKNIEVEVLDLDTQDPDEYDSRKAEWDKLSNDSKMYWLY